MSSTIDWFECPICGGHAHREQDNRTCEIYYSCADCNWHGESKNESEDDCSENGFYNTPAECENVECADCRLTLTERGGIDCPYR